MNHPPQREMWYPGCFTHLAIMMVTVTFIGWLING
jgi:hypothetical protein